ncbi:MAG: lamin tail domain-containing protein [Candidatus Delongbacteria bacterium]
MRRAPHACRAGLLLLACLATGCLKDDLDDGGPAAGGLVLNEFCASNGGGSVDELGEADDWVELHNPGPTALPLDGLALSDDPGDPDKFVIQGTDSLLAPGGFVVIWCDDETPPGPFHAPFKLSADGETLQLRDAAGRLLDERVFGPQLQDQSEGRVPDGAGDWQTLNPPTAGQPNEPDGEPGPGRLVVNELLASNDACCVDEHGEYDDWFELHNAGGTAVQLAGLWLSDDAATPRKFQLLPGGDSLLAPGAFAVVWCDSQPGQGPFHAAFALSGSGEDVLVTAADGETRLETVSYPAQQTDRSLGRRPDGGETWQAFDVPTPGHPNQP